MTTSLTATLVWAQRSEWVYIKIELQDVKNEKIEVSADGKFAFTGTSVGKSYTANVQLFGELDVSVMFLCSVIIIFRLLFFSRFFFCVLYFGLRFVILRHRTKHENYFYAKQKTAIIHANKI